MIIKKFRFELHIDDEKLIEDKKRNSLIKNIRGGM